MVPNPNLGLGNINFLWFDLDNIGDAGFLNNELSVTNTFVLLIINWLIIDNSKVRDRYILFFQIGI